MQLPSKVKDILLNQQTIQLGTASAEGIPNVCHIGCKQLREDGKIVLIDNYMKKTKANVLENPQVAVLLQGEKESYQLKGTCKYVDKGEEYDAAYQWFRTLTDKHPAKGALIVEVTEVYDSSAGENAGKRVA